jgi:hypothetical protein
MQRDGLVAFLVLLPLFVVIVPVIRFAVELPFALVRGLLSSHGWIEAVCWWPQTLRITWRIDDRRKLGDAFARITSALARGYEGRECEGVRIVAMTPPAGLRDLA